MNANRHRTGRPTTAKADMAAYDALPPKLRAALNDAPENFSADAVLTAVAEDGLAEADALALLAAREDRRG